MNLNDIPLTRKERKAQRKRAKLMSQNHGRMPATLSDALTGDKSLPLDDQAKEYWLKDLKNPLRIIVLPTLRILLSITLHITSHHVT